MRSPFFLVAPLLALGFARGPVDLSKVSEDPRLSGVKSEAGMIEVNPAFQSQLFYWFFPSLDASSAPQATVLWLQGGPGSSGFIGNLFELGPVNLDSSLNLTLRETHWASPYHLLFVDSPAGTGYSDTQQPEGYAKSSFHDCARDLSTLLEVFFKEHSELLDLPFYITGESYGGHYVPTLASWLLEKKPIEGLQLAGIAVGNGFTHPEVGGEPCQTDMGDVAAEGVQVRTKAQSAYNFGLIDDRQLPVAQSMADQSGDLASKKKFLEASSVRTSLEEFVAQASGGINPYDIRLSRSYSWQDERMNSWLNKKEVKEALHVPDHISFKSDNPLVGEAMAVDFMMSTREYFLPPLEAGLKVLLYQGAFDWKDGVISNQAWMDTLPWSGIGGYRNAQREEWRDPLSGDVFGYWRTFGPLMHCVIRNAGHMVPMDQPEAAKDMLDRFIQAPWPVRLPLEAEREDRDDAEGKKVEIPESALLEAEIVVA